MLTCSGSMVNGSTSFMLLLASENSVSVVLVRGLHMPADERSLSLSLSLLLLDCARRLLSPRFCPALADGLLAATALPALTEPDGASPGVGLPRLWIFQKSTERDLPCLGLLADTLGSVSAVSTLLLEGPLAATSAARSAEEVFIGGP